jgi:hypothetical protein
MADTVQDLFRAAANRLRVEFEGLRQNNLHSGGTGTEVERVLLRFLDEHLPRRFDSTSAILIDIENNVSKQCDIAVYDALNSPVYRASDVHQILPIDHVVAVIEVKTSLNKAELTDAYEKIASCKALKKKPLSDADKASTGHPFAGVGTLGVVFAFASDTTLKALADNARELNERYDSNLWPDLIVVFDKGVIAYTMQFPNSEIMAGVAMPPATDDFQITAAYHILCYFDDGVLALNRFFIVLLSALTFFPHRPSTMPFKQMLARAPQQLTTVQGYQYDTNRKLKVVPPEEDGKKRPPRANLLMKGPEGKPIAQLAYFVWQNGGAVFGRGLPVGPFIATMMPGAKFHTVPTADGEFTSVLELSEEQFRAWPERLAKTGSNVTLELFTPPDDAPPPAK